MLAGLETELLDILKPTIDPSDPSHDLQHIQRVLNNAKTIAKSENADLEVVIPAAIFHDFVTYPKNDPRNKNSVMESADKAAEILDNLPGYPKEKVESVKQAIKCTSYSYGQKPVSLEDKVVKDADMLEATGAISIMRTFTYGGKLNRAFYNPEDPFGKNRSLDDMKYSIDLFYTRLLKIKDELSTESAKKLAGRRSKFLEHFIEELKLEIEGK